MARSVNAQLAVDLYNELQQRFQWTADRAWHGIAILLLSCELYTREWEPFHGIVTYVDSNRFRDEGTRHRAERLTSYLADQLGIQRNQLCERIALYWQRPEIRHLQPHNLVGHAFRSLIATVLKRFGDPEVDYEEEADPHNEFPGYMFQTRSRRAKIDIVARRGRRSVALLSVRWRIRHNRMRSVDEALAYVPALRRQNPNGHFYAVIGEFDGGRLRKLLSNCAPATPNAAISGTVHFAPQLIRNGLGENGTLEHLHSLEWLIQETFGWR
jgi:hypothetical protein